MKINIVLIIALLSATRAYAADSSNIQLNNEQLDFVSAGFTANVVALAGATSDYLSLTKVNTVTSTQTGSNPALPAGVAVAGGQAIAAGVGSGSSAGTYVLPSTSLSGSNVISQQHTNTLSSPTTSLNATAVIAIALPTTSPF
jgi:hypothetical protein